MAASFAICVRSAACFIAAWLLALSFAHADPAEALRLPKELDGRLWRIASVQFERSGRRYPDDYIQPRSDDGSYAYLSFINGEISGSLGCGQLTGRYSFSEDGVQISASWRDDTQLCSSHIRQQAEVLILALKGAVRLERGGEDAFNLIDEQKNYYIRLELLSPGLDLSEFRTTFWQLISLEGNAIAEQNAEVQLRGETMEVSKGGLLASFPFHYKLKKFSFSPPWKIADPRYIDKAKASPSISFAQSLQTFMLDHPFFSEFEKTLHKISSYSTNGDELATLDSSGRQIMLLKRIRSTGLEYRFWHIAEYAADGRLSPTVSPQFLVVTFVRGTMEGTAGCGALEGAYTLTGDSLSIQAGYVLAGLCFKQSENENRLVLDALNKASRIKEDGIRMLLQDDQGNTNIVLVPYAQQMPR